MYILNSSFMVDYDVHDHWLNSFRSHFLPLLRESGFAELLFMRVVSEGMEGHFTYSLQIPMADLSRYREFTGEIMSGYATACRPVYGDKVLWFISLLKKIDV